MIVRVLLFGPQADLAGTREVSVELAAGATCAELREALRLEVPALAASLTASALAINHAYADEVQAIREVDEIALIGMVSGG